MSWRLSLWLTGIAVFFLALISFLPLSFLIGFAGSNVSARSVEGTIWDGALRGAVIGGHPLGDLTIETRALPLLTGALSTKFSVSGPIASGEGVVSARLGQVVLSDTRLDVDLSELDLVDAFGAKMSGDVQTLVNRLVLRGDKCARAEVLLTTDTFQQSISRYGGEGFVLAGEGRCEDGAFILPLAGEGAEGRADIEITMSARSYTTETEITPFSPAIGQALLAYGFVEQNGVYTLIQRGDVIQ